MKKKAVKKKALKKITKRGVKKVRAGAPKKKAVAKAGSRMPKPVGKVTHFYPHIKVAIVKFNTKIKAGTELWYKGATTDFKDASKSMQFDHEPVKFAPAKKLIGIKVKKRVREGDLVYKA